MKKTNRVSVADFLAHQIAFCDKSQKEIAEECGFEKPNIISMFKKGTTRLPVDRVPALAKALGVDPVNLLSLVMSEYSPETWSVIQGMIGKNIVTDDEMKILDVVRTVAGGQVDVCPETEEDALELAKLTDKWRKRSDGRLRATMERVEREKKERSERYAKSLAEKAARATGG